MTSRWQQSTWRSSAALSLPVVVRKWMILVRRTASASSGKVQPPILLSPRLTYFNCRFCCACLTWCFFRRRSRGGKCRLDKGLEEQSYEIEELGQHRPLCNCLAKPSDTGAIGNRHRLTPCQKYRQSPTHLLQVAEKWATPSFVYDIDRVRAQAQCPAATSQSPPPTAALRD